MSEIPAPLREVKAEVAAGQQPARKVRDLVSWFGAQRRGAWIVGQIEAALSEANLVTDPDFRTTWIDAEVVFRTVPPQVQAPAVPAPTAREPEGPDYLVRMLESANREVISVNPEDPIEKAVTLMMMHDISQLAVMSGERDLKGALGWKSIGMRLSQKGSLSKVRDAIDHAEWVLDSASLFEVVAKVVERDFVFVRAKDRKICGIVTASDLSQQFHLLSEPFLILGRIEAHLRRVIGEAFDVEALRSVVDEADAERKTKLTSPAQLTFGEYQRLLERDENWGRLGFVACRKTFCAALDEVRNLRNEIMHFHPDALQGRDIEPLRQLLNLLETLKAITPPPAAS